MITPALHGDDSIYMDGLDKNNADINIPNDTGLKDLTMTELCGQFEALFSSHNHMNVLQVILNEKQEKFMIDFNFVNSSRSRKMFKRVDTDIKELYWYRTFGAMINSQTGKLFVTHCGFKNSDLVLVAILQTRCSNPNYEALVCNKVTNEVFIMNKSTCWLTKNECDLSAQFDDAKMRR